MNNQLWAILIGLNELKGNNHWNRPLTLGCQIECVCCFLCVSIYLVLWMQINLSCTLHRAEEVTELAVYLFHQLLQRVQPALLSLWDTHTHTEMTTHTYLYTGWSCCHVHDITDWAIFLYETIAEESLQWHITYLWYVLSVGVEGVALIFQLFLQMFDLLLSPVVLVNDLQSREKLHEKRLHSDGTRYDVFRCAGQ